ncbi:hypothetical protein TNCV_2083401 [Trichonephila clavipes]|nr:hypothetical protein TNCV_2083401 [Trichonephila clavipes]
MGHREESESPPFPGHLSQRLRSGAGPFVPISRLESNFVPLLLCMVQASLLTLFLLLHPFLVGPCCDITYIHYEAYVNTSPNFIPFFNQVYGLAFPRELRPWTSLPLLLLDCYWDHYLPVFDAAV